MANARRDALVLTILIGAVMLLIWNGAKFFSQIAYATDDRLGLAEKTIKHYMTGILGKLRVRSRVEAALVAYREGITPPPPVDDEG